MAGSQVPSTEESLRDINQTLKEILRPRIFFNIVPGKNNENLLYVVLRNSGGSPAYKINVNFDEPLQYYEGVTLSQLEIFKDLPFLEQGREISFFFNDFATIIEQKKAFGPKETIVTLSYNDKYVAPNDKIGPTFTEKYRINIERYKGILSVQQLTTSDVVRELGYIRKGIEKLLGSGLLIKTIEDLEKERRQFGTKSRQVKRDHNLF